MLSKCSKIKKFSIVWVNLCVRIKQCLNYENNKRIFKKDYNHDSIVNFYDIMSLIKNFENITFDVFIRVSDFKMKKIARRKKKRLLFDDNFNFLRSSFKRRWKNSISLIDDEIFNLWKLRFVVV